MDRDAEYFDAIVVGGGPAGSTAATFIAMGGNNVLLLEKDKQPIYKIGESLLPSTVHGICPMLGVADELKRANFVLKRGGMFQWGPYSKPWMFSFADSAKTAGPTSTAYQVERMKFDRILIDNARKKGVEVREREVVFDLIVEDKRVVGLKCKSPDDGERICRARYVIDASGHESRISRYVGQRQLSSFFRNIALFGYYEGGDRLQEPNEGNIFCAAFEHGWFWYIPLGPQLTSVGAVVGIERARDLKHRLDAGMQELIDACPPIKQLLKHATRIINGPYGQLRLRQDYSYTTTSFWRPGFAVIGDAACFVDPVFSSGVHLATYAALLVARSVNSVLNGTIEESRAFAEFEGRYRREFTLFYDFLLAFYDSNHLPGKPFWDDRTLMASPEIRHEAFISLVAGLAHSGERLYSSDAECIERREGLGAALFPQPSSKTNATLERRRSAFYKKFLRESINLQFQGALGADRPREHALLPEGLAPSGDGLNWIDPGRL